MKEKESAHFARNDGEVGGGGSERGWVGEGVGRRGGGSGRGWVGEVRAYGASFPVRAARFAGCER